MKVETEIKLRVRGGFTKIRHSLRKLGFRIVKHRAYESNTLFDNSKRSLRKHGKLIRVRRVSSHTILTFKGPSQPSRYKKRREVEFELPYSAPIAPVLNELGYHPVFRYEKYRTEYAKKTNQGKVLVDETPIGNYLELEGSPRWIDRTAKQLGFSKSDYITRSYGYLYLAYCRERRIRPKDMLFKKDRKEK
ncbi:MAG TPA: class IV adenylate cyclase [Bryobacteraceae bacterium]|nr:class IV adenylate cyclase [Bryobacteraceae bacterium]